MIWRTARLLRRLGVHWNLSAAEDLQLLSAEAMGSALSQSGPLRVGGFLERVRGSYTVRMKLLRNFWREGRKWAQARILSGLFAAPVLGECRETAESEHVMSQKRRKKNGEKWVWRERIALLREDALMRNS